MAGLVRSMQPAKTAGWSRLNVPIIVLMQLGGFPARRARNDVRKPRNFVNFTTQWQALAQAFSRCAGHALYGHRRACLVCRQIRRDVTALPCRRFNQHRALVFGTAAGPMTIRAHAWAASSEGPDSKDWASARGGPIADRRKGQPLG
jgi:hypothetical protein